MNIRQSAAKVRSILKTNGVNPKGLVRVRNHDFFAELTVDLRGIYGDTKFDIEDAINDIEDDGTFDWNVE